jgi:hypothetical protein
VAHLAPGYTPSGDVASSGTRELPRSDGRPCASFPTGGLSPGGRRTLLWESECMFSEPLCAVVIMFVT